MATSQFRKPENWLAAVNRQGHGADKQTKLTQDECVAEMVMMGLRTSEGVNLERLKNMAGGDAERFMDMDARATLIDEGLVRQSGGQLVATDKGRMVLNSVTAALLIPDR
jgi:oxygen-independent coproporphyrinogen-3 oxidase